MKLGKVSQAVMQRSMLRLLQFHRKEAMFEPTAEEMCFGIVPDAESRQLMSSVMLAGDEKDLGVFALAQVVNQLASRGARTVGVDIQILLPPYAYESRLKAMTEYIEQAGSAHGVQILGIRAQVSSLVSTAVMTMNGVGILQPGELIRSSMAESDRDVVLLGSVAPEGMLRVLRKRETELQTRFIPAFLRGAEERIGQIFLEDAMFLARKTGVSAIHPIGNGGILAALWDLCESARIGISVELKKMNICQETVEICEFCGLNPYQLTGTGGALLVTDRGEELCENLRQAGYPAGVIGRTTAERKKIITGGEEIRYIDRPAPDEWHKLYEEVTT